VPGTNNLAYYEKAYLTDVKSLKHWPMESNKKKIIESSFEKTPTNNFVIVKIV